MQKKAPLATLAAAGLCSRPAVRSTGRASDQGDLRRRWLDGSPPRRLQDEAPSAAPQKILQKKCQEVQTHLYISFVGLTKAFNTMNREKIGKTMHKFGCSERFRHMVHKLYDEMMARDTDNGATSEAFTVTNEVEQDCVFAPTLFSLVLSAMLMDTCRDERPGIFIAYRIGGHLLNGRRMRASTRLSTTTVHVLLFADDCAFINTTEEDMQRSMVPFASGCANFGLTINMGEMVVTQHPNNPIYSPPSPSTCSKPTSSTMTHNLTTDARNPRAPSPSVTVTSNIPATTFATATTTAVPTPTNEQNSADGSPTATLTTTILMSSVVDLSQID
ncbi:hypothetical protein SprV_0301292900 [Sparganum proliferum]